MIIEKNSTKPINRPWINKEFGEKNFWKFSTFTCQNGSELKSHFVKKITLPEVARQIFLTWHLCQPKSSIISKMQATVFCFKAQILIWVIFHLFQLLFHLNFENLFDFTKVMDNRYGFLVGLHNFLTFQAFYRKQGEMLDRSQIFRYLAFFSRSNFFTIISIIFSLNQPVLKTLKLDQNCSF